MQNWVLKFFIAILLIIVGYKAPTGWLSISAAIWVGYAASRVMSPFLVAYMQDPGFAKTVKLILSALTSLAAGALISAPVVMFHLYQISYFSNR